MTVTASDAVSVAKSLHRWEIAEYVFAALVTLACAGEYVADFTTWFTGGVKERKEYLAKCSTLLLVAFLALELACLVKTNSLSGMLVGSLRDEAGAAEIKSQSAIEKSSEAENKANAAVASANFAQDEADAVTKQAETLVRNLNAAQQSLGMTQMLVSARSMENVDSLTGQLRKFKGQTVIVRSYMLDGEAYFLCSSIFIAAHSAEMDATDECGRASPTVPPITQIAVQGPNDDVVRAVADIISNAGHLGVASGPYGNAPKPSTLVIFVGVKSPFGIGQARPTNRRAVKQAPSHARP